MRPVTRQVISNIAPLIAVVGYVGLLMASHFMPQASTELRVAAFVWLVGWGVIKFSLFYAQQRKDRRRGGGPGVRP